MRNEPVRHSEGVSQLTFTLRNEYTLKAIINEFWERIKAGQFRVQKSDVLTLLLSKSAVSR